MAASLTSLVNQRLACASLLLGDVQGARSATHHKALLDACLMHLCCAYQFYVRELAQYYGVKSVELLTDESEVAEALATMGKTPAEIQELQNLAEQPDSWLSRTRLYYHGLWEMPTNNQQASPAQGMIAVKNIDVSELPEVDAPIISELLHALQEVITRHRETALEC